MSDTKHGWVSPRADGLRARCGGPGICATCDTEREHAALYELKHGLSQDAPGPLEPVEIAPQPGAAPATGNTARDQEMYVAGIRTGEENAKHNAAIRASMPDGWELVTRKTCYALMHDGAVIATLAGPESETNAAIIARMLAAPGVSTAGNPQPARDWELTCHECDGSGHVYVKHQVAERQSDVQEFKEECDCCEGRGFVFAFQDIPGIEEYVKTCRPAPAGPGVSTVEDAGAQKEAVMDAIADALGDAYDCTRVWHAWSYGTMGPDDFALVAADPSRVAEIATAAIAAMRPAPAAGDALDAQRYRWVRDQTETDGIAIVMKNKLFDESRTCAENIDKFIDAALAAQVPQQGEA